MTGLAAEVLDQHRDVLAAIAERRDLERHHGESVEEIEPKASGVHVCIEIMMGGADHPHIDGDLVAPSEPPEALALQRAQQGGR